MNEMLGFLKPDSSKKKIGIFQTVPSKTTECTNLDK